MRVVGRRVVAVLLGVGAAFLVAESLARVLLAPLPRARLVVDAGDEERRALENARTETLRIPGALDQSPEGGVLYFTTPTGKRFRANTRAVIENHPLGRNTVEIRTNSLGYRNREVGPKTRPRVLFLGDSITAQDYLPEQETIVRQVERLARRKGRPLETVNAGVGAIGLANELAILLETGLSVDPDVIVLNWYLNDAEASPGVEVIEPVGWLAWSRLAEWLASQIPWIDSTRERSDLSGVSPEVEARWRQEVAARFPAGPGHWATSPAAFHARVQELVFDWGAAWSDGAWDRMRPLLHEMKRLSDEHGARFLIVAFPVREQVWTQTLHDDPQKRLAGIAREIGAPLLDLLPLLRKERKERGEPLFLDWCHPSPRGSAIIAAAILEFLEREKVGS